MRLISVLVCCAALAACDGIEERPSSELPPTSPPPTSPPTTSPPPSGQATHFEFAEGERPTGTPTTLGSCGIGDRPGAFDTRIVAASLDLTDSAFTLALTLRPYPHESSAPFDSTISGRLVRNGALLRLTGGGADLFATLGPAPDRPTTVTVFDPTRGIGGLLCRVLRFTSDDVVNRSVTGPAEGASFNAVSLGSAAFPYRFQEGSSVFLSYDSLRVDFGNGGRYTARLYYRRGGQNEGSWAPATAIQEGTFVGDGAIRALDPSGAGVMFMTQQHGTDEAVLYGPSFGFVGPLGYGLFNEIRLRGRQP